MCLGGDSWFDSEWLKLSQWYLDKGDFDRAVRYAERAYECRRPRSAGMIPAWIAGVEARWTQELVRGGQRDAAAPHFARAERDYRTALRLGFEPAPMQSELGTLYAIVGKPAEAVAAFEAAEKADYLDAATAAYFARAYVALGRCAEVERIAAKVERAFGVDGPSKELRAVETACAARPAPPSR